MQSSISPHHNANDIHHTKQGHSAAELRDLMVMEHAIIRQIFEAEIKSSDIADPIEKVSVEYTCIIYNFARMSIVNCASHQ